jgi:hypothetical protein
MRKTIIAALAAASLALPAVATADSAENPKAPIQENNFFCGADLPNLNVLGFTNYHRIDATTVSVNYHLRDAEPNTTYEVQLWGGVCSFFGVVETVTTNRNGVANGNGTVTVPEGVTRFFATSWDGSTFHDTPAVELP